jgi:hypothetical protein
MEPQTVDLFLNATALSRMACDRQYQVTCQWGYPGPDSDFADFGSGFHAFAEYYEAKPSDREFDAIEYFTKVNPTKDKNLAVLATHYSTCDPFRCIPALKDKHGNICLEYKFAFPALQWTSSAGVTYRAIICGTMDRIDLTSEGAIRIIDRKTSRNAKTKDVLFEYETHIQIPFYQWVLKRFLADEFEDDIANRIKEGRIVGQYHGIFLSFNPAKFELGNPIPLTPDMEDNINKIVGGAFERMIAIHQLGTALAPPTGMAHHACKYCHLKYQCITRKDENVMKYLSACDNIPYDPRTWR